LRRTPRSDEGKGIGDKLEKLQICFRVAGSGNAIALRLCGVFSEKTDAETGLSVRRAGCGNARMAELVRHTDERVGNR